MKTKILSTKNLCLEVRINEDGTLWLSNNGKTPTPAADCIISSLGGIDTLLSRCVDVDISFDDYREARKKAEETDYKRRLQEAKNRSKIEKTQTEAEIAELQAAYGEAIPATRENIRIVLRYLNAHNWGSWRLPKMTIGYSANQYDCDGHTATTMKFDKPIDGETKFVYGAPHGHLMKYRRKI